MPFDECWYKCITSYQMSRDFLSANQDNENEKASNFAKLVSAKQQFKGRANHFVDVFYK